MKEALKKELDKILDDMIKEAEIECALPEYTVEIPNNRDHGDFAANCALKLAKAFRKNPLEIAGDICTRINHPMVESAEAVRPGFINFRISNSFFEDMIRDSIDSDKHFRSDMGGDKRVMVEFVSANPTGPLHIGHGRNAAYGDSVARILEAAGYSVQREYYVNDAGKQMLNLSKSILARYHELIGEKYPFPEDGYKGDYIMDVAKVVYANEGKKVYLMGENEALKVCLSYGLDEIGGSIKDDLAQFRVEFDEWFSEKSLYDKGDVQECLDELRVKGHVYDKDGAVWFASTKFGDDKDRVVQRQNGEYTYFASDIAYHRNKYKRGVQTSIDVWGADHHGYVKRLDSAVKALGYDDRDFEVVLIQMVNLVKDGERVSMSTRAGEFITLKWLLDEVGIDASRFFYLMRDFQAQFDFDLDLAKKRTSDNPVYYVQYAHARVCSLLSKAEEQGVEFKSGENLSLLTLDDEQAITRKILELKGIVESAASHREPHRIVYYLQDLASMFHSYYYNTVIIMPDNPELTGARLSLALAVASAVRFGLGLLGVSAPERM
ncbi:arginine--tRNA ligase [Limisalsivibrio acetivorans]|uniref:arginine--tRNA ligase n=1 Tax=Limisalsivibrio acetivorans TaxID=1304888 RepID=UPI0003B4ED89|nr:arginine--tRNA ligase [Limisalsivibrio acetivorans]